jgi:hypothetical protein
LRRGPVCAQRSQIGRCRTVPALSRGRTPYVLPRCAPEMVGLDQNL